MAPLCSQAMSLEAAVCHCILVAGDDQPVLVAHPVLLSCKFPAHETIPQMHVCVLMLDLPPFWYSVVYIFLSGLTWEGISTFHR